MSFFSKLMGTIDKVSESKAPAYYEVRWSVYSSGGGSRPMVEKFITGEDAREYADALSKAARFIGQTFWQTPEIHNRTPEPRGEIDL